jgi:hypothetical protein
VKSVALLVALALMGTPIAVARAQPVDAPTDDASESPAPATKDVAPPATAEREIHHDADGAEPDASNDPPPASSLRRPEGHGLVVGGVALVCTSLAGYVAMIVGLGIGSGAESRIAPLYAEEDIERRREFIERGTMGNRLAIGAGVSAAVLMATGIALIVVGRRRAIADRAQVGAAGLRVRF